MTSLYDDMEESKIDTGWSSNKGFNMMQSHMASKSRQQSQLQSKKRGGAAGLAPVVDLKRTTAEGEYRFNMQTGQMERFSSFGMGFTSFHGDICQSLGIEDEYDPLHPNDYEVLLKVVREKRKKEEEEARKQREAARQSNGAPSTSSSGFSRRPQLSPGNSGGEENSDLDQDADPRSSRHHRYHSRRRSGRGDEDYGRGDRRRDDFRDRERSDERAGGSSRSAMRRSGGGGGAAIAPPPGLVENVVGGESSPSRSESQHRLDRDSANVEQLGGRYQINSVAAKMMVRMGYRTGQGLGRESQGMSTALLVEKTSRRCGKIIHEKDSVHGNTNNNNSSSAGEPGGQSGSVSALSQQQQDYLMQQQHQQHPAPPQAIIALSNVVLLQNMVGPGEVDDDLEIETKEECSKFGPVEACVVYEIPEASAEEAVRIFVEFTDHQSALRACNELNGRYFGGRTVRANFYDSDLYRSLDLGQNPMN